MFKNKSSLLKNEICVQSAFTDLTSLVCAPIESVTKANRQANQNIIDAIEAMGKKKNLEENITILDYLNIQYKHVKNKEGQEAIEDMLLQVPLLSIIPVNSMKVKNAVIDFNAEVRAIEKEDQTVTFEGRVCAPEIRTSDYIPKVHFKIELENEPMTEGLARIQDTMDIQQITTSLDAQPINQDGQIVIGEQKQILLNQRKLYKQYEKTKQLELHIDKLINHQKVYFNTLLKSQDILNHNNYEEFTSGELKESISLMEKPTEVLIQLLKLDEKIQSNINKKNRLWFKENELMEKIVDYEGEKVNE